MSKLPLVVLVSTGLGRVNRGFEQYIHSLATFLAGHPNSQFRILVYGGKKQRDRQPYAFRRIPSIKRDGLIEKIIHSSAARLRFERFTFWLCMIPCLWKDRPNAVYLGEYPVYGWLFNIRKRGLIQARLALYTGGQAIPGPALFDPQQDFIHHITDFYFETCKRFPAGRQQILPHFIDKNFSFDQQQFEEIKRRSGNKRIVLSVGAIEKSSKRMDLLLKALALMKEKVFPVLLGEPTADSSSIEQIALEHLGTGNYCIQRVSHNELGTWYQAADIFILCSPKESFGLSMVEALFHGLPVACFRFAESEFVMRNHAKWLVATQVSGLSAEIGDWLTEMPEYKCCKVSAHQFADRQYTIEKLGSLYYEMFLQILE